MLARIQPFFDDRFVFATLTQRKKGSTAPYKKVQVRPFLQSGELSFQLIYVYDKKVLHENLTPPEAAEAVAGLLTTTFDQAILHTTEHDYHLTAFHGRLKIRTQPPTKADGQNLSHDKRKAYAIPDGEPCDFLIRLGVMNAEGHVLKARYDKFRQINKYLEIVADIVDELPRDRVIHIVDFGCGKSYLTFGLYYYLVKQLHLNVKIIGLDLKDDVIRFCEEVARELEYDGLTFLTGDIQSYTAGEPIDMVVTLHACDVATDAAIVQAIGWDCRVLLTVPCCQHELFSKIRNDRMHLLTKHGILKERLSALITDAIRGQLLEACGYDVDVMEFISMEHTPKNLMIRAVRNGHPDRKKYAEYLTFAKDWSIRPYLEEELVRIGRIPARSPEER